MGDALAVALLEARGFSRDDFALSHPGGSLGRRLLLHVRDIMHPATEVPVVREQDLIRDAVLQMTSKKLVGMTAVVDADDRVIGIFTDGDLRRLLERGGDINGTRICDAMTRPGARVGAETLAAEALRIMETKKINALLVVDGSQRLAGALNMHDLLRARIL
jgi:arabinose-5-phosphate isomerase